MSVGATGEDRARILESLETVVRALVGRDLESLQRSVGEIRSEIAQQIEDLRKETAGNVDALRASLASEAEESKRETHAGWERLRDELLAAVDEAKTAASGSTDMLKETVAASIAEFRTRASKIEESIDGRVETAMSGVLEKLESATAGFGKELSSLSKRLDSTQGELRGHVATSSRVAEVLDDLGNVLARRPPEADAGPVAVEPDAEHTEQSLDAGADHGISDFPSKSDLEDVLERVFPLTGQEPPRNVE